LLRDATAFFHFCLSLEDRIVSGADFAPSFYRAETDRLLAHLARLPDPRPRETISEPVYVPWLWKYHEYGHFLTEMVPRVLLVQELYQLGMSFPVLVPANPRYVFDAVQTLAPALNVQRVDDYVNAIDCSCCLVPTSGAIDHVFHPHTRELLAASVARLRGQPTSQRSARVFLSRTGFRATRGTDFRVLANELELQRVAMTYGLEVVEPQDLSFADQVKLMSGAAVIVGEASSALHNALFAASAEVVSLGWINNAQAMIAGLQGQRLTYLLPTNFSDPSDYNKVPLDALPEGRSFVIDPHSFEAVLIDVLQRVDGAA
jgi:hypothetical protein